MSILNITRLTNDPWGMMRSKIDCAIEEYEKDSSRELSSEMKFHIHNYFEEMVEDFEENGKVADALSFVDNLLINHDYYATVKEMVERE